MAIGAILSKGVLIKGSIAAAGGTGLGVTWWQVYDNVRPKELAEEEGEGFILSNLTNNSNTDLDDIPYLSFDSEKYNEIFKDGECIKKYLPGKITNVAAPAQENIKDYGSNHTGSSTLSANGFSGLQMNQSNKRSRPGYGFTGTEGCLSINIKYNNGKLEKDRGIIGRMELVAWNDDVKEQNENKEWKIKVSGYGMIMSSIISNLNGQFKFINKLTFLKRNGENWDVLDFAMWRNREVKKTELENEEIKFSFGKETFSFQIEKENKDTKQLKNTQEYKKLARWFQGNQENKDKLLGYLNVSINGENSDIWQDLEGLIKNESGKVTFASDLFYNANKKWYKNERIKYSFTNFDKWNPGHNSAGLPRLSLHGTWVDIQKECLNKNSKYRNLCFNK